jgi:hypothetical protein
MAPKNPGDPAHSGDSGHSGDSADSGASAHPGDSGNPAGSAGLPAGAVPTVASPTVRIRWLVTVIAVMALLTAGWPLLNRTVSDSRPLRAGHSLMIGPGGALVARLTVGRGFRLLPAQSNPRQQYSMQVGAAQLSVSSVSLQASTSARRLWAGLRLVLSLSHPGTTLGRLTTMTSAHGQPAVTGSITSKGRAGLAAVFVAPTGKFAVDIVMLAPRADVNRMRGAGQQLLRSVTFLSTDPVLQPRRVVTP